MERNEPLRAKADALRVRRGQVGTPRQEVLSRAMDRYLELHVPEQNPAAAVEENPLPVRRTRSRKGHRERHLERIIAGRRVEVTEDESGVVEMHEE